MSLATDDVESALRANAALQPIEHVTVVDKSGGCGSAFDIVVVSPAFDGLRLVERHRVIHAALGSHMKAIHALQLKCLTPAAYAKQTGVAATSTSAATGADGKTVSTNTTTTS